MLWLTAYALIGLAIWPFAAITLARSISRTGRPDSFESTVAAVMCAALVLTWPLAGVGWIAWTLADRFAR